MSYCGECGTEDLVNNMFCTKCGQSLSKQTPEHAQQNSPVEVVHQISNGELPHSAKQGANIVERNIGAKWSEASDKSKLVSVLGVVLLIVIIFISFSGSNGPRHNASDAYQHGWNSQVWYVNMNGRDSTVCAPYDNSKPPIEQTSGYSSHQGPYSDWHAGCMDAYNANASTDYNQST
jgi:hypothetical protein